MLPQERVARCAGAAAGPWMLARAELTPTLLSAGSIAGSGGRSPAEMLLRFLPSRVLPLRKKSGCLCTPVPALPRKNECAG